MAVWSRKTLFFFEIFAFFGNTTPCGKCFKILFGKFSSRHWSACCVHTSWNLDDGKSLNSCVVYLTNLCGSPAVATVWFAPKICQGQPPTVYPECSRFNPNWFTFGGVIAKCVNTAKTCRKVNPVFDWILASSRITRSLCYLLKSTMWVVLMTWQSVFRWKRVTVWYTYLLLKMICNDFLPTWLKVVSSCLLQYKPVCVTNFDKLCRKMQKNYKFIGLLV